VPPKIKRNVGGLSMLHLIWKIKFWLLGIRMGVSQASNPLSLKEQEALESRLDFLIFEVIYAAHLSRKHNHLIPLTNTLLVLRVQHEIIKIKYTDFYNKHLNTFKMIENLSGQLDTDQMLLTRKYESAFKDPFPEDLVLRRLRVYVEELAGMYRMIYDGSFNTDCLKVMTSDQKSFYEKFFIPLQMETLSESA
jgi:hypothetical protein